MDFIRNVPRCVISDIIWEISCKLSLLPIQLTLLVLASKPPAVHGVIDVGLPQLVRRRHLVEHQLVQLIPALVNVVEVEGGEVCSAN